MDNAYVTIGIMSIALAAIGVLCLCKYVLRTENRYEEPEFKPLIDKWEPEN